jgi:phospholipid/cholesterol/gamma-HCH transport system substrate-binding protein
VDPEYAEAVVTMAIDERYQLSIDTGAKIVTEGILGGRYVSLVPGGEEDFLEEGDTIEDTQGALVFEDLIGDVIRNIGVD